MPTKLKFGKQFESEFFGNRWFGRRHREFVQYHIALERVKLQQHLLQWNPLCPDTQLSSEFFSLVRNNLSTHYSDGALKFFVALGSSLDLHFGVDCFFELRGKAVVTIDLTTRYWKPRKRIELAPDVVLTQDDILSGHLPEQAMKIADILQKKMWINRDYLFSKTHIVS